MKKPLVTLLAATSGLALIGCQQNMGVDGQMSWNDSDRSDTNAWLLRTYQGQQVENAITRQHTIWSHHFVEGTTALTPRGERDLGVLRDHYNRHGGGVLTVRRGEADDVLFENRLATLNSWLADGGVRMDTVRVDHGLYTGDGKRSTRAAQDYTRQSDDNPYRYHSSDDK